MFRGLMQEMPLLISSIARFARRYHADVEMVTMLAEGSVRRTTYGAAFDRAAQLAHALDGLGVEPGDRVGTIAWNDDRHFEIYYAVSGVGAICHTINPRLFADQLVYIVNHAEDRWLFVDPMFLPLVAAIADRLESVRGIIVLSDDAGMPEADLPNLRSYEALLDGCDREYDWPSFDENTASSLCYTSGTTGHPKGVLYSHRSTVLHSYACSLPDAIGLSRRDVVLPVVPMFHVNAWGMPYAAPMVGAKLVFPGPRMADGPSLQGLIEGEDVTLALGVPTIWLGLLQYLESSGKGLGKLDRTVVGGSACPPAVMTAFKDGYGVRTLHGWGMTEMSPLGTVNQGFRAWADLADDDRRAREAKQGQGFFGVEMRIVGEDGTELPWDGKTFGDLQVRGNWVCRAYFRREDEVAETHHDGWFSTGDVATIDPDGTMQIVDRTKDVIKTGGEWISSIDLENVAVGHPDVAEAAVIGVPHPKWAERPLLIVVKREGADIDREALLAFFDGKVATWWVPDDVLVVDELPHTATGKVSKRELRAKYGDHVLPSS